MTKFSYYLFVHSLPKKMSSFTPVWSKRILFRIDPSTFCKEAIRGGNDGGYELAAPGPPPPPPAPPCNVCEFFFSFQQITFKVDNFTTDFKVFFPAVLKDFP